MQRCTCCGVREEDLVALLYFLLASAYGGGQEVEAKSPEIPVRQGPWPWRRLVGDGSYNEIVKSVIKFSEQILVNPIFRRTPLNKSSTYPSKPNLASLLPSSSAVMHVGPAQGFASLLVPLQ